MDIKNLSSCYVYRAQEFFYYHFQINNYRGKANAIADDLFRFFPRSQAKEKTL